MTISRFKWFRVHFAALITDRLQEMQWISRALGFGVWFRGIGCSNRMTFRIYKGLGSNIQECLIW